MGWAQLPPELLLKVHDTLETHTAARQGLRVCHGWHHALTPLLYRTPRLRHAEDWSLFCEMMLAETEDAEQAAHLRQLASFVRVLDLHAVCGTMRVLKLPDLMARLSHLQAFTAPQAALTAGTMQQLGLRPNLRFLDLAWVIERFELPKILNLCAGLSALHTLRFPRCAVSTFFPVHAFPTPLKELCIRGGLRDAYVQKMSGDGFPKIAATQVEVSHAPVLTGAPMLDLLAAIHGLEQVIIQWPLPRFAHNAMDALLVRLPNLTRCSVSIDYISARFFENQHLCLERLTLTFSGVGKTREITADDLIEALEDDVLWPALKSLVLVRRLQELLFPRDEDLALLTSVCTSRGISLGIIDVQEGELNAYSMFHDYLCCVLNIFSFANYSCPTTDDHHTLLVPML